MKYLSLTTLALMGAIMIGCSRDNMEDLQQPVNTGNKEILSTTICMDGAQTRALTGAGVKTFAAGEQLAVVYKNTGGATVKAVSEPLPAGAYNKTAKFIFELDSPDKTKAVTYIYPASMANADGSVNYGALASQDGTLATLAGNLDLGTMTAAWDGELLPDGTLVNQLAICAYTIKNYNGSVDLTGSIIGLTVSDGTYSYTVNRAAAAGPIYVAINPTASANIEVTATADGSHYYVKSLTGKTYAAGNGYNISLRTSQLINYTAPTLKGELTFNNSNQSLVNAGTVDYGTILYSIDWGASWSTSAVAFKPDTYTVYYKVEPSAGYTGGVGPTLLGNVTMNKAYGWIEINVQPDGWGSDNPDVFVTITSAHDMSAIRIDMYGEASYSSYGGNSYKLHGWGGASAEIYCEETEYYTESEGELILCLWAI